MPRSGKSIPTKIEGDSFTGSGLPIYFKDTSGKCVGARALDSGELRVTSRPYLLSISEGDIPGHSTFQRFIHINSAISTRQFFSESGYVIQSSGSQRSIASASANDTSNGTGVRKAKIYFLDSSGVENIEEITMNGTNPVNTVSEDIQDVNNIVATEVGSLGKAAGKITFYTAINGGGTLLTAIEAGEFESQNGIYFVPNSKTLHLQKIAANAEVDFVLFCETMHQISGVFGEVFEIPVVGNAGPILNGNLIVPGGSYIKFFYTLSRNNELLCITLDGWIE